MVVDRLASRRLGRVPRLGSRDIKGQLERFARARARQRIPTWVIRAIVIGVAIDLVALFASIEALSLHLLPRSILPSLIRIALSDRYWMIVAPIALALVAAAVSGLQRPRLSLVARETDGLLHLDERVSTALELEEQSQEGLTASETAHRLALRQRADALAALRRHDPGEAFPMRLSRSEVIAVSAACLLLFGLVLLPEVTGRSDRQLAEIAARTEAERLTALADQIASDSSLSPVDRAALSSALGDAARDLEAASGNSQAALARLGQAERALAQQAGAGGEDSQRALARVADALDQSAPSRAVAASLDRGDYAGAAAELARLGDQVSQLSDKDRGSLGDALSRAARATSQLDPQLSAKLSDAAGALGQGSKVSPQSALAQAGEQLRRAGADAERQQALDRALAALQGAKLALTQSRSGSTGLARAEAGGAAADAGGNGSSLTSAMGDYSDSGAGGDISTGPAGGQNDQAGGNAAGGSGAGKGSFENRGLSDAGDFRSHQVKVPTDAFGDPTISTGQSSGEGPVGEATVDYRQVLADYRARATEAMAQRYIPPSLKELVAAYFTSLDSGTPASGATTPRSAR